MHAFARNSHTELFESWRILQTHTLGYFVDRQYFILASTAIVAFGGFTLVLLSAKLGMPYSDVIMAVFFSGSVGAVVNNYFRLSKIAGASEMLQKEIDHPSVAIQMWVSLFLSGILGFIAYGLFLSGLLQGELFPKFDHLESNYLGLADLLATVAPKTNLDAAKALFWAFIAGFSERFIPNALDALVYKAEQATKNDSNEKTGP